MVVILMECLWNAASYYYGNGILVGSKASNGMLTYHYVKSSVVDPKLFFSDPDPTFQEIPDPDLISDPT